VTKNLSGGVSIFLSAVGQKLNLSWVGLRVAFFLSAVNCQGSTVVFTIGTNLSIIA